jgi:hypothetical protein
VEGPPARGPGAHPPSPRHWLVRADAAPAVTALLSTPASPYSRGPIRRGRRRWPRPNPPKASRPPQVSGVQVWAQEAMAGDLRAASQDRRSGRGPQRSASSNRTVQSQVGALPGNLEFVGCALTFTGVRIWPGSRSAWIWRGPAQRLSTTGIVVGEDMVVVS